MSSLLFSPIELGRLRLSNRIIVSPMCQYSAEDGNAGDWHRVHLGQMAQSAAGMLLLEATAVEDIGRITHGCLGLYSDANEAALGAVLESVRKMGSLPIGVQLAHAGRKGSSARPWDGGGLIGTSDGGWTPVAPSALPHAEGEAAPAELDSAGLARIRQAFVHSAQRAVRIGLQSIELHVAHGYLLHQFLSPLANQRGDVYGGSAQARMRFPLEVFDAVRQAVPDSVPVGVRVSATDWVEGGLEVEQTSAFALELKARGCAWIDVSSGGVSPRQRIPVGPGYQVHLAQAVREACGLPTMAVGLITEPRQAEDIVREGRADMVALARAMLWDPRWPWHAAAALGASVEVPPQYWRSEPRDARGVFAHASIGQR
ncbi:MAG: NADH:flavin oxidoreductase/NADH oxidase [Betaproteobacteria bacterium]|nr:NADH:flavin oxidoreductase/NADH oxidase [Betaproteobacteria bacterium]MBU6512084.1 NADH:flavin oxidoreductase/NADH oxidase [Betaproteobacteria bacterium]MDE1955437.1 NADH:flavin oxidoreductase/NADH oxidase [Betaproteobacteria bacterium]MDE2153434.1 NADH:flavin oxidoreductase/NADH oxidase [Betaproteobacteria bacterium]